MLPNLWVFPVLFCISDFQHLQFFFFSCTEVKFSSVISQSIWYRVRRATLGVNPLSLKLCILLLNARWKSHDCSQTSPITQSISKALHIYMWGESTITCYRERWNYAQMKAIWAMLFLWSTSTLTIHILQGFSTPVMSRMCYRLQLAHTALQREINCALSMMTRWIKKSHCSLSSGGKDSQWWYCSGVNPSSRTQLSKWWTKH